MNDEDLGKCERKTKSTSAAAFCKRVPKVMASERRLKAGGGSPRRGTPLPSPLSRCLSMFSGDETGRGDC